MASKVTRYDVGNGKAQFCYGCYCMEKSEYGDFIMFEDYEKVVKISNDLLSALTGIMDAKWRPEGMSEFLADKARESIAMAESLPSPTSTQGE